MAHTTLIPIHLHKPAPTDSPPQAPPERFAAIRRARDLYRTRMRNAGLVSRRRVDRMLFEEWGWD